MNTLREMWQALLGVLLVVGYFGLGVVLVLCVVGGIGIGLDGGHPFLRWWHFAGAFCLVLPAWLWVITKFK